MSIQNHFQSPAIDEMCSLYGACWDGMDLNTRTAIMAALAECAHMLSEAGISERLDVVAANNGYAISDYASLYPLLAQLDAEITSVQDVLSLITGIAQTTAPQVLAQAA